MPRVPKSRLTLSGELRKQRAQITNKGTLFDGTGVHFPEPGVVQIDGNLWVTGDFTADGKISNDALTNPVVPQVARLYTEAFSLTTSYAQKASTSLTVPEGCTSLLAIVRASMYVVNTNTTGGSDGAGGDATYVRATLPGGNTGGSPIGLTGSNGFTTTTSDDSFQLTGLTPGGTVAFGVEGKSGYQSIPSYVDNWVKAVATLIWLR